LQSGAKETLTTSLSYFH